MNWFRTLIAGLALAIVSSAAVAFQEQRQSQGVPAASGTASTPPAASAGAPDLSIIDQPLASAPKGTEVNIPGLGRLGVIPKMDFGLELLYGAAESKQRSDDDKLQDNDGLTIRGSVKHKF